MVDGRENPAIPLQNTTVYAVLVTYAWQGVIPTAMLLHKVWARAMEDMHLLRVNISNLRRKVEPDPTRPTYIHTSPVVGIACAQTPLIYKIRLSSKLGDDLFDGQHPAVSTVQGCQEGQVYVFCRMGLPACDRARVAQASCASQQSKPSSNAARTVESTHMWSSSRKSPAARSQVPQVIQQRRVAEAVRVMLLEDGLTGQRPNIFVDVHTPLRAGKVVAPGRLATCWINTGGRPWLAKVLQQAAGLLAGFQAASSTPFPPGSNHSEYRPGSSGFHLFFPYLIRVYDHFAWPQSAPSFFRLVQQVRCTSKVRRTLLHLSDYTFGSIPKSCGVSRNITAAKIFLRR